LGAVATAAAEVTRTTTSPAPHVVASTPARKSKNYDTRRPPRQATMTASPLSLRDFATYFSIENAGGNNDTKCLYFPFCLDQAPLTWLESLEKYSIDKWDQLKVRTMCGLRTGGWSLPCVMSD
jgi:hypothetical protein